MDIVEQIVAERKRQGLTQEDLAQRVNRGRNFISNIETSGRAPNARTIEMLARALGKKTVLVDDPNAPSYPAPIRATRGYGMPYSKRPRHIDLEDSNEL